MSVKKIGLSTITVSDAKKSAKFFTEVLGLKISSSSPEYGWYEFIGVEGGPIIGVGQTDGTAKAGVNATLSLDVDDIAKSKKDLELKGVKFLSDIMEVPGEVKLALFIDLDGNTFYLVENLKK